MEPFTEDEFMYPSSDRMPKAETDRHRKTVSDLIARLDARYAADPNVYVSGNLKVYWKTWDPYTLVVPDCFVAFGVPKRDRDKYLGWQESALPSVVIEVFSTESADHLPSLIDIYQNDLRVDELFLFDPFSWHDGPPLQGYRRKGDVLSPLDVVEETVTSSKLGITIRVEGVRLQLRDRETGTDLLTAAEREAAVLRSELSALRGRNGS